MAIPVHLQQFKAAGIYRVVFDHSAILNQDSSIMRLVVGYSEQGPFNIPVYVKDAQQFKALFGDISKKLEKRGIFFHRLALQMLQVNPILCLNLKKFDGETVDGATISTDFNPKYNPIDTVKLNVEDIYDTTRFWELSADELNNLRAKDGTLMDQYINICTTNTRKTSATYFIRKASGTKVSGYNITVNDWYSDKADEMPEYLEQYKNNLISDFFAEIYVFNGKFDAKQVLSSDTLKNYFIVTNEMDENDEPILKLRDKVIDAFGDSVDTLDSLYRDESSNAIGHYIGCLIPKFRNKQGAYAALDIIFNGDQEVHNMMMSFNIDMLEEEESANIDLSGRSKIPTTEAVKSKNVLNSSLSLDKIYEGVATTSVLGNTNAPVIADIISFHTNVYDPETGKAVQDLYVGKTKISGTLYVKKINARSIILGQIGSDETVKLTFDSESKVVPAAKLLGVIYDGDTPIDGKGTYWQGLLENLDFSDKPFENDKDPLAGPERIIRALSRLEKPDKKQAEKYTDLDENMKPTFMDVEVKTSTTYKNTNTVGNESVYGSSISFIDFADDNWFYDEDIEIIDGVKQAAFICDKEYDKSLMSILQVGDCLLANDGELDVNEDNIENDADGYFDTIYVQEIGTAYYADGELDINQNENTAEEAKIYHKEGEFKFYYILISGEPLIYRISSGVNDSIVRVDAPLNQEIGTMYPQYLQGYTYKNDRPIGTGMYAKVKWQEFILSTLTDYKGIRTGLLNKSEIDYRYVIDTFESFPVSNLKNVLSYLCKEKQSAFCISNFPSVKSFVKCPYTSFTDSKGIFNVEYVVKGFNKKKPAAMHFSLPSDADGASFIAFYSPLKFSDGYLDSIIPSAGLVSNLFIEKYMSRQPYYIVAGPNYGNITAAGLVGPDYRYSVDELQIIEPFGVNVMVYRPNFGTFINANQTAKQTPVSALSKVNVRELVIYLQDEIEKVLQQYQWEFNNDITRNAILAKANQICSIIMAHGGIQAYKNIMDESNNTPEIIDNEMAVISTHIEPGMGCGKMVQELHIYRTGQMSASITE